MDRVAVTIARREHRAEVGSGEGARLSCMRDRLLGDFKRDSLNVSQLGKNQPAAQQAYDRAGWK